MTIATTMPSSVKGIVCMVLGVALLTCNDAVMKWLTADYPIGEIMALRGLFTFLPIILLVWKFGGRSTLRVSSIRGHVLRAGIVILSTFAFVTSISLMPLADAISITFAGPLFVTALATPLLGERVGWRRWSAVVVGFAGVMIILRPTGDAIRLVALFPLSAALLGALRDIVTRRLCATESSIAILCYSTLAVMLAGLCTLPFGWQVPPVSDIALLALAGLLLGGAHFLTIETFRHAEVAIVAPFKYSSMVWAVLLGFMIWGDLPDHWTIAGTALLITSGLYILHRETRR